MSLASHIVGIPGLEVERVHRQQGIEIWAKPFHRPLCLYCGGDQLRIKATYQRTIKHSRQGNRVMPAISRLTGLPTEFQNLKYG